MAEEYEQPDVGIDYRVEPLWLDAKDENGNPVQVDIMHMLATSPEIRKTWEAACRELFEQGFPANYVIQVGFLLKDDDGPDNITILVIPKLDDATDITRSSPEAWAKVLADA
ncbi:MAG TPA: hypothetical protein VJA87_02425 [Candidatus Paceibacterota bacterium]